WIDGCSGHSSFASGCLKVLKSDLKFNIYNISSSYVLNKDISELDQRKKDPELLSVHYAALFWIFHLLASGAITSEQDQAVVNIFSGPDTLYWLEILSLHGAIHGRIESLQSFRQLAERTRTESETTLGILDDMYHFLDFAKEAATISIPHIYISCLAYMPKSCLLGGKILPYFGKMLQIHGRTDRWILHPMVIEAHDHWEVSSVAYSPDGQYVISGSADGTVRVWDHSTGQPIGQPLQGHSDYISSISCSLDGKYIISGSWDQTIRIWDINTQREIGQPLHTNFVESVASSPDGMYVVSGCWDNTVRIWNISAGQ
ncbi:WD40 repeat-like protein, partial [Pluteus cervinus]